MILDYFFYDGKPDACACIYFFTVKFLKYFKNAFAKMGFEADAVVFNGDMAIVFFGWKPAWRQATLYTQVIMLLNQIFAKNDENWFIANSLYGKL